MSFYLNIDDINFDNTEPNTNVMELSTIDLGNEKIQRQDEIERNANNETESKPLSMWSIIRQKIAWLLKLFKFKH